MAEKTTNYVSKGRLGCILSSLLPFEAPKARQEQYLTPSEVAAEVLWQAFLLKDIENKQIADLGAGTGILGLGTIPLGAKQVFLVEQDPTAVARCEKNLQLLKSECNAEIPVIIQNTNVVEFNAEVDTVVQNPPFGTKHEHADKEFLDIACRFAKVVYSFHKSSTAGFVRAFATKHGFEITHEWPFVFGLKSTMRFHTKRFQDIHVSCFRLQHRTNEG